MHNQGLHQLFLTVSWDLYQKKQLETIGEPVWPDLEPKLDNFEARRMPLDFAAASVVLLDDI